MYTNGFGLHSRTLYVCEFAQQSAKVIYVRIEKRARAHAFGAGHLDTGARIQIN